MNHLYDKALKLRLEGHSYNEINLMLGIAKSTLSSWFAGVKLPQKAINRLQKRATQGVLRGLIKRNKEQTVIAQNRAKKIQDKAKKEVTTLFSNDLLIIGIALYWAEGYKRLKQVKGREITAHIIALTNSDPALISAFIMFLNRIMGIDAKDIYVEMRLFRHIDADEAVQFWMNVTQLPKAQFYKPMYPVSSASKGKRPKNRLPYGTVRVIVSNTNAFHRLIGFIDGLQDRLKALQ